MTKNDITREEAIEELEYIRRVGNGESPYKNDRQSLALDMATKSLKECRWIPITERIPEESYDSVIGWDEHRDRCVFVQFYNGQFQISGSNETFDITHWMPMLTPPYERSKADGKND